MMDINSKKTTYLHQGDCDTYEPLGVFCTGSGSVGWIDKNTLIFTYHNKLPFFSFEFNSPEYPGNPDHVMVMTTSGDTLLSADSPPYDSYAAFGGTIFRYTSGSRVDAWLDGSDLENGLYKPNLFCDPKRACIKNVLAYTSSPDGHYILSSNDSKLIMNEVKTGHVTQLGSTSLDAIGMCHWSPDETKLACLSDDATQLEIISTSNEMDKAFFNSDQKWEWAIYGWRP